MSNKRLKPLLSTLKIKAHNYDLFEAAFTHPSVNLGEHKVTDYQRLEFVGDSVLGAIIASLSYKLQPNLHEGHLTRLRSSLVDTEGLSRLALSYHFDKYPAAWSVTYDVELDETRTVEIGGISREITEVTEKNGTFLSSNMQQWWRDVENETIFLMLTKPDGYIRSIMHMSGEANKSMETLATLVGGSAHSWYLQPVGWDSTDSPL